MSQIQRTNFFGDTNLGLYAFATDAYCVSGVENKKLEKTLNVPLVRLNILNTDFTGLFAAGNASGIAVPAIAKSYVHQVSGQIKRVLVIKTDFSAIGNLLLLNDKGVIVSPLLKKHFREIKEFFGLPCAVTTIAKQRLVGSLGLATNRGCLLHPKVRKNEMKIIEETLCVAADIGTVNYGSPYPGAGVVANSFGFVASEASSGPELGRINEALGFLEK